MYPYNGDTPVVDSDIDGNIFSVMGAASRAIKRAYPGGEGATIAKEMTEKVTATGSYDEALQTIMQYVEFN